ncbi:hypothetical protein ACFJGX_17750 [Hydrogenophaga sp. UC242_50]|uniref:hypothetical protein n=1 Tax=Hydrogenophaga sp. UC242_50 TaxID=3350169 RepID=UPI0036D36011
MSSLSSTRPRRSRRKPSVSLTEKRSCAGSISSRRPARAQPPQAQLGRAARADDELGAARQLVDEFVHQAQRHRVLQGLEVVEEERERRGVRRHVVDHREGQFLQVAHGRAARARQAGHQRFERGGQHGEEAAHVVVRPVQREPGGGQAGFLEAVAHLQHHRGLAEARRGAQQHQPGRPGAEDLLADLGAHDLEGRGQRGVELGRQRRAARGLVHGLGRRAHQSQSRAFGCHVIPPSCTS